MKIVQNSPTELVRAAHCQKNYLFTHAPSSNTYTKMDLAHIHLVETLNANKYDFQEHAPKHELAGAFPQINKTSVEIPQPVNHHNCIQHNITITINTNLEK